MRISDWSSDVCSSDLNLRQWIPALAVTSEGEAQLRTAKPGVARAQDRILHPIPQAQRDDFITSLPQLVEGPEQKRSAARRAGEEGCGTGSCWWVPDNKKKKNKNEY